jgi:hypothetical protein
MARRMLSGESVPLVTTLPPSPADGQVIDYLADSANGVIWRFRYRAASASAYKWEFVGGAPMQATAGSVDSTTSTTYADLPNGPSVTVPLAGDYQVEHGGYLRNSLTATSTLMSFSLGAAAAVEANSVVVDSVASGNGSAVARTQRITGLAASAAITAKYRVLSGTGTFIYRGLTVTPVRVG